MKDVALIRKEGKSVQLSTEHLEGITRVLEQAQEEGLGDEDYSAIYNVISPII